MPYSPKAYLPKTTKYFVVYVCGAVQNEGFVRVRSGSDVAALVSAAGYLPQSYFVSENSLVTEKREIFAVDYFDGEKVCSCVNVNSQAVLYKLKFENIDSEIIDKIADYISAHGKITNKAMLREILGETDYQNNHYKFFVSKDDYEAVG